MRLQLTPRQRWLPLPLVAAALAAAGHLARADDGVDGSLGVYADDDHVTVVSPRAAGRFHAMPSLEVEAAAAADAVTGASVDVVTSASPATIHERRIEGTLGATAAVLPTAGLGARAVVSHEHDYDAVHASVHGSLELAKRNTLLGATYDEGFEEAGSVVDRAFHASRRTHHAIATLAQVLGTRTVADAIVELARDTGYHASPYRSVIVEDPVTAAITRLAEVTPRVRESAAASLRLRQAIGERSAIHAMYRFYVDDWELHSHTGTVDALHELAGGTRVGLGVRAYVQDGAFFYRDHYDGMPALRTRDRTLGPMRTLTVRGGFDLALSARGDDGPRLVGELAVLRMWFLDFTPQRERTALTTSLGVTTAF